MNAIDESDDERVFRWHCSC